MVDASKKKMILLISIISLFLIAGIGTSIWYFTKDIGKSTGGIEDYFEKGGNSSEIDYAEMAYGELDSVEREILKKDEKIIKNYIDDKDLSKFKKTEHGSFYRIEKEGNGKFAERGDEVWVHSNGLTLDGKKFFSTYDYKQPLSFKAFTGQMIPGFDEAIGEFDEGSEGIILVPSPLAYADQVIKGVPKYAIMRFDIKIVKIKLIPKTAAEIAAKKKAASEYGMKVQEKDKSKGKGFNIIPK
ncbi:MAG: FKBP-type peptidyl-prolyl cis-trans isomerase [Bacteroidetes bacterium]|jgi:FKBP-type peptidyl-prolyl cis-trans isomerase|nr:FKBP-type peptidyl-prolyl cis-trans isomerase [Bacteroidota bacterium]